jgi:hypothetical protein
MIFFSQLNPVISYGPLSLEHRKLMYFSLLLCWFSILSYNQMLKLDLEHHNYVIIITIIFSAIEN